MDLINLAYTDGATPNIVSENGNLMWLLNFKEFIDSGELADEINWDFEISDSFTIAENGELGGEGAEYAEQVLLPFLGLGTRFYDVLEHLPPFVTLRTVLPFEGDRTLVLDFPSLSKWVEISERSAIFAFVAELNPQGVLNPTGKKMRFSLTCQKEVGDDNVFFIVLNIRLETKPE